MRLSPVLQRLLVLISVLSLTRAQTTPAPTTPAPTTPAPAPTTTAPTTVSAIAQTTGKPWTAPAIFYPFGSAAGDTEHVFYNYNGDESYVSVGISTPYTFFGRTYNQLYVHSNGLLTFNQPQPASGPNYNPTRGAEDFIAPLWGDIDDQYSTVMFSYHQYRNGSVLTRATQDINQYFPQKTFTASSVFVVTWEFGDRTSPAITLQVVLISGGGFSFFLMNYGNCAMISDQVQAGYDTINSTNFFVIPDSINGNYQNLKNTSNVNVPGRWAFLVNNAPGIFYPFGSAAGDTEYSFNIYNDESYVSVGLSTPYTFFGRTYNQLYVHSNGLLTFNQPEPTSGPNYNPTRGAEDFIAPLWSDIDDYYSGVFSYHQYRNGSVLTRATQDINQYFPQMRFNASSVFVVTWEFGDRTSPAIKFQVVLISGGGFSFFLMNYGNCAVLYEQVQAGYDTINSTKSFVIPDSINGNYQNLNNTSNIKVPGRWAFLVNNGSESVIGVQLKVASFTDLTQSGNIEILLQKIKQDLVSHGLSSQFELKLRKVKKTQP